MCSWCYGFQPTIRALVERDHAITLALGSLGSDRARPMRDSDKAKVRQHWEHVSDRSGQPFDFGFFDRDDFVYDTAPSCGAVAIVRARFPALAVPFLGRLQERFYALGQDITDAAILREAVSEFGIDPAVFDQALRDPATAVEINAEWQQTAALGVTGYPTLLALEPGRPRVITIGWQPTEEIIEHVAGLTKTERMAADRR
jgi:putative protein-disulfide isomerase